MLNLVGNSHPKIQLLYNCGVRVIADMRYAEAKLGHFQFVIIEQQCWFVIITIIEEYTIVL